MLREALHWLTTPCPTYARKMGFLKESIAIPARYERCHEAWHPHLEQTRTFIVEQARQCPQHRIAMIFGTGALYDIPLGELSELFEQVWLVDIVHPLSTCKQIRDYDNVRLITQDVTEMLESVATWDGTSPLTVPHPTHFCDEEKIDYVASVNLLSQLPHLPAAWLHKRGASDAMLEQFSRDLMTAHLGYLHRLPGRACLITDAEESIYDRFNTHLDTTLLLDTPLPAEPERTWKWHLAPYGERWKDRQAVRAVAALSL